MLNPIFNLIEHKKSIKDTLKKQLNVNFQSKEFVSTRQKYYLFNLPETTKDNITLNGINMQIVDLHLTIPEKLDKNHSSYHFTITVINPKTKLNYKVRLFFDKLDRINVEPKLFSFAEDDELSKYTPLSQEDFHKFTELFMPFSKIILFLRKQQKIFLNTLASLKNTDEVKIDKLNEEGNIKEIIESIEQQIERLSIMISISGKEYLPEKRYYERMLKRIQTEDQLELEPQQDLDSNDEEKTPSQSPYSVSTTSKKPKSNTNAKQPSTESIEQFITNTENIIKNSNKTVLSKLEPSTIKKMVNKVSECNTQFLLYEHEDRIQDNLHKIKFQLRDIVAQFFIKEEAMSEHADLYLLAVKAGICNLSDKFIAKIIKSDDIYLLEKLLESNLISDSMQYCFDDANNFTIVEWCVFFGSENCFKKLLSSNFSLNYINEEKSPLYALIEDPIKSSRFLTFTKYNEQTSRKEFYNKMISMLKKRCKDAKGEALELLETKISNISTTLMIHLFLDKNIKYKSILGMSQSRSSLDNYLQSDYYDPKLFKIIENNLAIQKATLEENKRYLDLLRVMKPAFINSLKNNGSQVSPEQIGKFFTLPLDIIISIILKVKNNNASLHSLHAEIIESGEASHYENGQFVFRKNSKIRQNFIAEIDQMAKLENEQFKLPLQDMLNNSTNQLESHSLAIYKDVSSQSEEIDRNNVQVLSLHTNKSMRNGLSKSLNDIKPVKKRLNMSR